VLIAVEHAPDLVVGSSASSLHLTSLAPLCFDGFLDELQRTASKGIYLDQYFVTVQTPPVREVRILGTKALDEYEQIE
jgi:hypothetical protein